MGENDDGTPIITHERALGGKGFRYGYIKCRLVHLEKRSFVMPDILLANGTKRTFFSPKFFTPNVIYFFGDSDLSDHCLLRIDLCDDSSVKIVFFKKDIVKRCADGSFIYKCAFKPLNEGRFPKPQGIWRKRNSSYELALYHHTDTKGKNGIKKSKEIWSSAWNIQGTEELQNISYGYFTSLHEIKNEKDLSDIAMASDGFVYFIATNSPWISKFAQPLKVYRQSTKDRNECLEFWVDTEIISPNHLWFHKPNGLPSYYEVVMPKIFRVGMQPGKSLPFTGNALNILPENRKNLDYAIVGDADTADGLRAPYCEEETQHLAKVDKFPDELEIIARWHQMRNSELFSKIKVELAELKENRM